MLSNQEYPEVSRLHYFHLLYNYTHSLKAGQPSNLCSYRGKIMIQYKCNNFDLVTLSYRVKNCVKNAIKNFWPPPLVHVYVFVYLWTVSYYECCATIACNNDWLPFLGRTSVRLNSGDKSFVPINQSQLFVSRLRDLTSLQAFAWADNKIYSAHF